MAQNQDKGLNQEILVILDEFCLKLVARKQVEIILDKLPWWPILCRKPAPDQANNQDKINPVVAQNCEKLVWFKTFPKLLHFTSYNHNASKYC